MHVVTIFFPHVSRHCVFNQGNPTASSQAVGCGKDSERDEASLVIKLERHYMIPSHTINLEISL